jgi:hypothetical protein
MEEGFDETPPPDHDDFLAVRANGLRAIGRRWEMRRRRKVESDAAGVVMTEAPREAAVPPLYVQHQGGSLTNDGG